MELIILENPEEIAERSTKIIIDLINKNANSVLGLATGSTPVAMYKKLIEAKGRGSITKYRGAKKLKHEKLFELPVDILIPASIPDVITEKNYKKVKANIIVEAANIPIPHDIEHKLYKMKVLVVPDIIANAGGVISSYAEHKGYNPKDMFGMIERKITKNTSIVLEKASKNKTTPRASVMGIAEERVNKALSARMKIFKKL